MSRLGGWNQGTRLAALGLSASAAILAGTIVVALRPTRRPLPAQDQVSAASAAVPDSGIARAAGTVAEAVGSDPFRRDRTRPPWRYQLPEVRPSSSPGTTRVRRPAMVVPVLRGTASDEDGKGLAILSISGRASKVLAVGQEMEGWMLIKVEKGSATLRGGDTTIVLPVVTSTLERRRQ